jgi:hypothetical protein
MKPRRRTFADRLSLIEMALSAEKNKNIRDPLLKYNFGPERFNEGRELYEQTEELDTVRYRKMNEQKVATMTFRDLADKAKIVYADNMKIARVALRDDPPALQKLELTGPRKKDFSLWLAQAKAFYKGALEVKDIQQKLNAYALTKDVMEKGLELVINAENAREKRNRLKADAQNATKLRNESLAKATKWRSALIVICRIALRGPQSQLMEQMGLTISSKYSEQTGKREKKKRVI